VIPKKKVNPADLGVLTEQPQQNTFKFDEITISSEFCSGNLGRCVQVEDAENTTFNMWMSGDGLPYQSSGHYKSWFYFSVKGLPREGRVTFSVKNMALQSKLYKMGLRPVFRTSPHSMKWKRFTGPITWGMNEENTGFMITWTYQITNFNPETDTMYWAWTYPYSFEESLKHTQKMLKKYKDDEKVYIHREVLNYSREGRP